MRIGNKKPKECLKKTLRGGGAEKCQERQITILTYVFEMFYLGEGRGSISGMLQGLLLALNLGITNGGFGNCMVQGIEPDDL